MTRARLALALAAAMLLGGCASSLSGVGGTDRYACKAPEGAACMSVSGVYANSAHGVLRPETPPQTKPAPRTPVSYGASAAMPSNVVAAAAGGASLRSSARVLKLWIAPWEDADGDLHEEGVVHVVVDTGRWLIEHVRPVTRSRVDGALPPAAPPAPAPEAPASAPGTFAPAPLPPTGFPPTGFPPDTDPSTTER